MGWWKRRLPKKRWKRVCLYLLSTLLILLAADMLLVQYWRRIEISPETTRITTPLNVHGTPDYVAAMEKLYDAPAPDDRNAVPPLLRIIGTENMSPSVREQTLPPLGLPATPLPPRFTSFYEWQQQQQPTTSRAKGVDQDALEERLAAEEEEMRTRPWTTHSKPAAAKWLDAQQLAIRQTCEAADREHFYLPLPPASDDTWSFITAVIEQRQPVFSGCHQLGTLLAIDAMHCAGEHDAAGFRRDVLAQMKLARHLAGGPILIDRLVGVAVDALASRTLEGGATDAGFLDAAAARQLLADRHALPPLPSVASALDTGERWLMLDQYCAASTFGWGHLLQRWFPAGQSHPLDSAMTSLLVPVHLNAAMRNTNRFFDQLVSIQQAPTYSQRQRAWEQLEADQERIAQNIPARIVNPAALLTAIAIPSFSSPFKLEATERMYGHLSEVSLALAIYRANHGQYPDTLAALAPSILPSIPDDLFSDKPLLYRTTPTGYLLYSVGPNEKDDNGTDRRHSKGGNYDLVVQTNPPPP